MPNIFNRKILEIKDLSNAEINTHKINNYTIHDHLNSTSNVGAKRAYLQKGTQLSKYRTLSIEIKDLSDVAKHHT